VIYARKESIEGSMRQNSHLRWFTGWRRFTIFRMIKVSRLCMFLMECWIWK